MDTLTPQASNPVQPSGKPAGAALPPGKAAGGGQIQPPGKPAGAGQPGKPAGAGQPGKPAGVGQPGKPAQPVKPAGGPAGALTGVAPVPVPADVLQLTALEQAAALKMLPPSWAVYKEAGAAHGKPFTSHEYVVQMLDTIFLPSHWSFTSDPVQIVNLPNGEMVATSHGTLSATFADGSIVSRSNTGVWPVRIHREAEGLEDTTSDEWRTSILSADTDALKGCAGDLGRIFRPLMKADLYIPITRDYFSAELRSALRPKPVDPAQLERNKRILNGDGDDDLVAVSDKANGAAAVKQPGAPVVTQPAAAAQPDVARADVDAATGEITKPEPALPGDSGQEFYEWHTARGWSARYVNDVLGQTPAAMVVVTRGGYTAVARALLKLIPPAEDAPF